MSQISIPGINISDLIVGGDSLDTIATNTILPSLRINALNSEDSASGAIPPGSWVLVNNKSKQPLGKQIDVLPLAVRPMGIDMSGQNTTVVHDANSQAYKEIVNKALQSPPGQLKSAMYGPQFLMVCNGQLVTLFCANQSMMGIYTNLKASILTWVSLTSELTKAKKGTFFAPIFGQCLNPPALEETFAKSLETHMKAFITISSAPEVVQNTDERPQ